MTPRICDGSVKKFEYVPMYSPSGVRRRAAKSDAGAARAGGSARTLVALRFCVLALVVPSGCEHAAPAARAARGCPRQPRGAAQRPGCGGRSARRDTTVGWQSAPRASRWHRSRGMRRGARRAAPHRRRSTQRYASHGAGGRHGAAREQTQNDSARAPPGRMSRLHLP
jgi:hypothetical protein